MVEVILLILSFVVLTRKSVTGDNNVRIFIAKQVVKQRQLREKAGLMRGLKHDLREVRRKQEGKNPNILIQQHKVMLVQRQYMQINKFRTSPSAFTTYTCVLDPNKETNLLFFCCNIELTKVY